MEPWLSVHLLAMSLNSNCPTAPVVTAGWGTVGEGWKEDGERQMDDRAGRNQLGLLFLMYCHVNTQIVKVNSIRSGANAVGEGYCAMDGGCDESEARW